MKYLVFLCALVVIPPLLTWAFHHWPGLRTGVIPLLILLTVKPQDINFISMEWYRGTAKGFEISLVDLLCLGCLGWLCLQNRFQKTKAVQKLRYQSQFEFYAWPPGSTLFALYWCTSALSIVNAAEPLFLAFELFKMLRMYLMFWVCCHWIQSDKQLRVFLRSVALAMLYIFYEMLNQKYLQGMWQARGPFPHQNSLVMYVNLFNCLLFSHVLNQKRGGVLSSLFWLSLLCVGLLCTVFTFSRGGLLFLGLGLGLVLIGSLNPRQLSLRKLSVLALALIAGGLIAWKASDSVKERFDSAPEESMEVRAVLAIAALKMVADKPLGVGLNHFGLKINPPYSYGDHIPRKETLGPDEEEEKGGLVETVYLMIAAECGWHSLLLYLFLLWSFCFRALRLAIIAKDPWIRALSLGLGAGLVSIYLESCFEWVLKQSNNFYQLMMVLGLILALETLNRRQRQQTRPPFRRKPAVRKFSHAPAPASDRAGLSV